MGWYLNDPTSLPPKIAPNYGELSEYTGADNEVGDLSSSCMNGSNYMTGTAQDNFVLLALPVGGLPRERSMQQLSLNMYTL